MNNAKKLPKNPLKLTLTSMQSMQRKAGQNTFGGRFGGRKSSPETKLMHLRRPNLYFRQPNPFGGKFRRRKGTPETKVSNLRRHLRRPNSPPEPKVQKLGGKLGQPKPPPQGFDGRMYLRLPNLSSSARQKLALPLAKNTKPSQSQPPPFLNMHTPKYMLKGVKTYL